MIVIKSDLDFIAMFDTKWSSVKLVKLTEFAGELSRKYLCLVRDVGIAVAYYDYTVAPQIITNMLFLRCF